MVLKLVAHSALPVVPFILAGPSGAGDTRATALITFITVMVGGAGDGQREHLGWAVGAWVALVADQLLRSLLVVLRYKSGKWKTIRV